MSLLYIAVLAVIVVALLAVAVYRTSQVRPRPTTWWPAGLFRPCPGAHLLTSWIGAGSLFAGGERLQERLCRAVAAGRRMAGAAAHLLHRSRARKFAQFTLPDLLEARYNQTARVLGTSPS